MTDTNKTTPDLPSMVEQAITGHPGYPEFAAWCERQRIHPGQIYFLVWQASREAVVVELPELRSVPDRDCWARTNGLGFNSALKEARQVIEAQGLKVAP